MRLGLSPAPRQMPPWLLLHLGPSWGPRTSQAPSWGSPGTLQHAFPSMAPGFSICVCEWRGFPALCCEVPESVCTSPEAIPPTLPRASGRLHTPDVSILGLQAPQQSAHLKGVPNISKPSVP